MGKSQTARDQTPPLTSQIDFIKKTVNTLMIGSESNTHYFVSEVNFICVSFSTDIKQWFHKNIKLKIRKIGGTEAHFVQTFLWILTICSFDTLVLALWFISNAGWDLVVFPF